MRWLTFALAALYGWIGLAGSGAHRVFALAGALCIAAAPLVARRLRLGAAALLVVGVLPLAVVAWWSIAALLVGTLALLVGGLAIRRTHGVLLPWSRHRRP